MATYIKATGEVKKLANEILEEFYQDLQAAGVTIGYLMAHAPRDKDSGEPAGPALKHGGYPAAGIARIVSLKDRVGGLQDAIIYLDGDQWPEWTDKRRRALLHHEINHLELRYDEEGGILLDDANRPKLKIRLHDFHVGSWYSICERYREDAVEVEALEPVVQRLLPIFETLPA